MDTLIQDLRYGIRTLIKNPGFTIVAVIALALGIGANTAIFSVVNSALLRPLPYQNADRLVMVWSRLAEAERDQSPTSPPDFFDWRDQNQVFDHLVAIRAIGLDLTSENTPEQILGGGVSADFFSMLGVEPAAGRSFLPEDDLASANPVVIISHSLWARRFGSSPEAIGKQLTLSGKSYTLIGVLPRNFQPPESIYSGEQADLWIPLAFVEDDLKNRRDHFLFAIGRLKSGITLERAESDMNVIAGHLEQAYPETNRGLGVKLVALKTQTVGDVGKKLFMLLGAVSFVLLIACANVANMLLARAAGREREIAIRLALGARRGRVVRQLITESVLLAVTGGALGLLLALWGVDALVALSPGDIPRLREIGIDKEVLAFTLLVSVMTGLVFGLMPALHSSKPDINKAIKEGSKAATMGIRGARLRSLLVVSEIALVMVLLIGAGLLLNSLLKLQQVSPGFNSDRVITMRVFLSPRYEERPQQIAFFKELIERIEPVPGVQSVGAINDLPLSGNRSRTTFSIEGQPPVESTDEDSIDWRQISPNYFRTMSIPLLAGRDFTERDDRSAPPVIIVNESMARRSWPDESPIGKRVKFGSVTSQGPWIEVVGVVGDIRHSGLSESEGPCVYIPYLRSPRRGMYIVARASSAPASMIAAMQKEVWAIDKDQTIQSAQTMNQFLSRSVAEPRFYSLLLGIFAAVALIVAAVGVYGIMSYSVAQRTHEIGVRMALGANHRDVMRLIVGHGLALTVSGIAAGLLVSLALTRVLSSLLYEVTSTDPTTFVEMTLLLAVVAFVASYIPARRATRVDPMVALRYE